MSKCCWKKWHQQTGMKQGYHTPSIYENNPLAAKQTALGADSVLPKHTHALVIAGNVNVNVKSLSRVRLFVTPWTVADQAPPPMGFSRQEYWSGLPFPSPDLPDPGIEPGSPAL